MMDNIILIRSFLTLLLCSLATTTLVVAQVVVPLDESFFVIPSDKKARTVYYNDFSSATDSDRLDQFVVYRDPFVINHTVGRSDHASTGGINCTAPEQTRQQTRKNPKAHVYQCLPGGKPELGHQMAFAMDTSGYGFAGALPDKVFEGVTEVSVDINTTNAGARNFVEVKIIPANKVFLNGLPCVPDFPCNQGWDYNDIGGVGASTDSTLGTGLTIATPIRPDGYHFDNFNARQLNNGDTEYQSCEFSEGFCFHVRTHETNTGIRKRFKHIFRDNGDGTLAFGIENEGGHFSWVNAPGAFPSGSVRVMIAFHNYIGTKGGDGPGANGNVSPSKGGFTWHWDELEVKAKKAVSSMNYYNGTNPERIVTPDNCIAFTQGQREFSHHRDILPRFHCVGDADLEF